MRLLYIYIESYRCFRPKHPIAINFTTDYRFEIVKSVNGRYITSVSQSLRLPMNFFSYDNRQEVVAEISAIFGENGSGKTTLAAFLQRIRMPHANELKFVVIFESEKCHCWKCITTMNDLICPQDGEVIKEGYPWSNGAVNTSSDVEDILKDGFDYVYFSPHFTIQQAFDVHDDPSCINLSTTYLLSRRPEYFYNKDVSNRDRISFIQRGYETEQMLWALEFAAEYVRWDEDARREIDIPAPRNILVKPNEDMADISRAVLIKYASASRLSIDGDNDYALNIYKQALLLTEQIRPLANDVFFGALWVFLLNYFRNVPVENKQAHRQTDRLGLAILTDLPVVFGNDNLDICEKGTAVLEKINSWGQLSSAILSQSGVVAFCRIFKRIYEICLPLWKINTRLGVIPFEQEHFGVRESKLYEIIENHALSSPINSYLSVEFSPPMASGESTFLTMFSRLYWYFKNAPDDKKDVLIFMDEAETTLHPEWQQKIVSSMILFLDKVAKGRKVHMIFASHSPMLLSDIPIDNAVFLKRRYEDEANQQGAFSEQIHTLDSKFGYTNSFGANVIDLLGKSFFMQSGTIGRFAKKKINDAVTGKLEDRDAKIVVGMIGDSLIKDIAKDMLEELHGNTSP